MEVSKIYEEVSAEFGKVLPLKIREDAPTAYFDWESITLPKRFLKWNDDMLKNVIRHEFGHLFFSPRDPDVGTVMYYIASVIGYLDSWRFVNILTDIIVDTTNMELFGEEYLRFLEWSTGEIKNPCPIIESMEGVYREKAKELGLSTKFKRNDIGTDIYEILNDESRDFYLRVIDIAKILYIPDIVCEPPLHYVGYIYVKNNSNIDIARAMIKKGIKPKIVEDLFLPDRMDAGDEGMFRLIEDPIIIEYEKMRAIAKYMELKNDFGSMETMERESSQWNIGDPPENLDVIKTISNYGMVVPGVYSLKMKEMKIGNESGGRKYKDCIIILDSSGSMEGDKFERARESSYIIARKTHEDRGKVGLIPFSGDVLMDFVVYPTIDYWRIVNLIFGIIPAGGTKMNIALQTAISMGKNYHVYIFSDADVYNVDLSSFLLEQLKGRVTFFLINDEVNTYKWFKKNGVKIVEVSPDGVVKGTYMEVR